MCACYTSACVRKRVHKQSEVSLSRNYSVASKEEFPKPLFISDYEGIKEGEIVIDEMGKDPPEIPTTTENFRERPTPLNLDPMLLMSESSLGNFNKKIVPTPLLKSNKNKVHPHKAVIGPFGIMTKSTPIIAKSLSDGDVGSQVFNPFQHNQYLQLSPELTQTVHSVQTYEESRRDDQFRALQDSVRIGKKGQFNALQDSVRLGKKIAKFHGNSSKDQIPLSKFNVLSAKDIPKQETDFDGDEDDFLDPDDIEVPQPKLDPEAEKRMTLAMKEAEHIVSCLEGIRAMSEVLKTPKSRGAATPSKSILLKKTFAEVMSATMTNVKTPKGAQQTEDSPGRCSILGTPNSPKKVHFAEIVTVINYDPRQDH